MLGSYSLAASGPAWRGLDGTMIRMAQWPAQPRQHDDSSSCMVMWVDLCNNIGCHRWCGAEVVSCKRLSSCTGAVEAVAEGLRL